MEKRRKTLGRGLILVLRPRVVAGLLKPANISDAEEV
jgi:hypothetical protein